jgi:hypothetical protein
LYGVWTVDSSTGWPSIRRPAQITLDGPDIALLKTEDGKQRGYLVEYDATAHSIRFTNMSQRTLLNWDALSADRAELHGDWMGTPVTLSMHRDPEANLLTSRGFHWVQEEPFNR